VVRVKTHGSVNEFLEADVSQTCGAAQIIARNLDGFLCELRLIPSIARSDHVRHLAISLFPDAEFAGRLDRPSQPGETGTMPPRSVSETSMAIASRVLGPHR
jgi:hypothetical protein